MRTKKRTLHLFVFFDRRSGDEDVRTALPQFRGPIREEHCRLGAMKTPVPSGRPVRLLSETLSNQIAAGEVVERPASVVKELVENALDAHATRIVIEVQDGGRKEIRVVDDGHGMERQDAERCILRHATSKIRSEADLHSIETLGFRGEALPSIGSVSRLLLKTRRENDSVGTLLRVDGEREATEEVGCPVGTSITVSDLFFNVPARLKFMRSRARR